MSSEMTTGGGCADVMIGKANRNAAMAIKIFMVCVWKKGARAKRCVLGVVGFVLVVAECAEKGHFDPAQRKMVI
jgi:hypothetical protein